MERRQFLGMVVAGVGSAALGGASVALASEPVRNAKGPEGKQEPKLSPEAELVGYCGRYCGKCSLCAFNVSLGATALQKVSDTVALSKSAERIGFPPIHDMAVHCCSDFDRELASLVDVAKIAFPPGCRKGCAPCEVAPCCRDKGYLTCAECDAIEKCEKIDKYRTVVGANLRAIRKDGLEKWAKAQHQEAIAQKKAELHAAIDGAF